jgi:ribonuclease HI
LERNEKNEQLFKLVERAVEWLKINCCNTTIVKWETKAWGEIPADFGRK